MCSASKQKMSRAHYHDINGMSVCPISSRRQISATFRDMADNKNARHTAGHSNNDHGGGSA